MLELALTSTFDVVSFNGTKSLVLTSLSPLGNLQESVAVPCIVVGCLALVAALVWFVWVRTERVGSTDRSFAGLSLRRLSAKQRRTMRLRTAREIHEAIL
jgi:hypothetical protein